MRRMHGFTLIELMIVVAIVGILSMIALPAYNDYVTRGKIQEATSQLSDLRVKMEQYYMDNRRYGVTAGGGGGCGIGAILPVPPQVKYFGYTCTSDTANAAGDQKYQIIATGVATEGMGGFVLTIDSSNAKATTGVGAGWNAAVLPLNCWVQKKGGTC